MFSLLVRRAVGFVAISLFFIVAAILLLSDRSGSIIGDVREVVVNIGQRVEQTYGVDVVNRGDIPGTADQLGHAALWGAGMALVGWIVRRRVPVPITALFIAGVSLAFEVSQPMLSATRTFEPSDAAGNAAGIAGAAVLLSAVLWSWRRLFGRDCAFDDRLLVNA